MEHLTYFKESVSIPELIASAPPQIWSPPLLFVISPSRILQHSLTIDTVLVLHFKFSSPAYFTPPGLFSALAQIRDNECVSLQLNFSLPKH